VHDGINTIEGESALGYVGYIHHLKLVTESGEFLLELPGFVTTSRAMLMLHGLWCSEKMDFNNARSNAIASFQKLHDYMRR
jgi:hypothetical protein